MNVRPKSPVQETDVASSSATPPPPTPSSTPPQDPEALKAQGNTEFKAGNYYNAIDFYSKAIGESHVFNPMPYSSSHALRNHHLELNPSEPNYWNNRAAAYIAVKKFGSALTDAQTAATLQSSSPQIKTLLRLARCHLALGNVTGALNTLTTASELPGESANSAVLTALQNAKRMQQDLATYLKAREQKDWGVARLALDRCIEGAEGNGSDEWKRWKIEMEIAKGRWDSATSQTA
jgi:DnaJ homolog subfamily C member 7